MSSEKVSVTSQVASQLPPAIRDKVRVRLRTDAFGLAATVVVADNQGRIWTSPLDMHTDADRTVRFRVPETFIAQLCAVV